MDRGEARSFVMLYHRVKRVPQAIEYCCNVFGCIFAEIYPLDHVPSSLEQLCRMFSQPAKLCRVVNHQIQSGACCAFALVHSHWPGIELMTAARGPPGGWDEPMEKHNKAATEPSRLVGKRVCEEDNHILGALVKVKAEPEE